MAMSFDGIASGLPTDQMIKAIMSQESAPLTRLQNKQDTNNLRKNALSSIKSTLMSVATAITSLKSTAISKRTVSSSDSTIATATATGAANGTYDLKVSQLATKAKLETTSFLSSTGDSVGEAGDTFTVTGKKGTATITASGNMTLAELNNAINAKTADTGVSSTIIQKTPGQYHLVLTSTETGDGEVEFSTTSSADWKSKDPLNPSNPPTTSPLSQLSLASTAGQNAKFSINGIDMERDSNTIKDAIEGVTLSLNSANPGKTVTLNVSMDKDAIIKIFQDVVNKFNSAYKAYKDATAAGGPLDRDMSMQAMFTQARSALSQVITGTNGRPAASSASIGLKTEREGTLSLDTNALSNALDENPELVGQVFDKMSTATTTYIDRLTIGSSSVINTIINGIDSVNSLLTKQIDNLNSRLTRREEVLKAQFAKMETMIGQMQKAGQSLGGLSSWN